MSLGASLKKGFSVTKQSFSLVFVLFLFGFVWNLLNIYFAANTDIANNPLSPLTLTASILFVLLSIFMQAGSLGYVRDRVKTGNASLSAFMASGGKYYFRLFFVGIIVTLIIGLFVLVAALAMAGLSQWDIASIIAAVVIAAIGIYFVILLFLAPYIAVADDQKALASIKKSVVQVRKNILTVLGIAAILILIGFLIGMALGGILALLNTSIKGNTAQIIFAFLSGVVNSFLGVLVTASFMSFYLGLSTSTEAPVA